VPLDKVLNLWYNISINLLRRCLAMEHKKEVVKAIAYHMITLPCLDDTPPYQFKKHIKWHYSEKIRTECEKFFKVLLSLMPEERRRFVKWLTGVLDE
jgi:hypothetical protein